MILNISYEWRESTERLWPAARKEYPAIKAPVLLVYGEEDWAPPDERERARSLIPAVVMEPSAMAITSYRSIGSWSPCFASN